MDAGQIIRDWARTASPYFEASDYIGLRMKSCYPNAQTFYDKRTEIMTFILEGLSTQDQDDFAKGVPFIGDRFISRDNKKLFNVVWMLNMILITSSQPLQILQ